MRVAQEQGLSAQGAPPTEAQLVPLVRLLEDNKSDMYIFYAFGLVVITLTFGTVASA